MDAGSKFAHVFRIHPRVSLEADLLFVLSCNIVRGRQLLATFVCEALKVS